MNICHLFLDPQHTRSPERPRPSDSFTHLTLQRTKVPDSEMGERQAVMPNIWWIPSTEPLKEKELSGVKERSESRISKRPWALEGRWSHCTVHRALQTPPRSRIYKVERWAAAHNLKKSWARIQKWTQDCAATSQQPTHVPWASVQPLIYSYSCTGSPRIASGSSVVRSDHIKLARSWLSEAPTRQQAMCLLYISPHRVITSMWAFNEDSLRTWDSLSSLSPKQIINNINLAPHPKVYSILLSNKNRMLTSTIKIIFFNSENKEKNTGGFLYGDPLSLQVFSSTWVQGVSLAFLIWTFPWLWRTWYIDSELVFITEKNQISVESESTGFTTTYCHSKKPQDKWV